MRRIAVLLLAGSFAVPLLNPSTARAAGFFAAGPVVTSSDGGFSWVAHPVGDDANSNFAEPGIDVDHANRVYVTANGGGGSQVWRSFDGGQSFEHKSVTSTRGGGDSEIEFDLNDVGYTADLRIVDSMVSRSTDQFATWTQQSVGSEMDRQWLGHLCEKIMYLAYHDFVVEAELINRSDDGGKTWSSTPVFISPGPGNQDNPALLADQQVNTFSGPVAVDQKTGDVFVVFAISSAQGNLTTGIPPFGQPEQIVMGVSHDGGKSFALKLLKAGGAGTLGGLIFPWVTIDKAGTVYASWAGRDGTTGPIDTFLTHSNDRGNTWSKPLRVNQDVGPAHLYTTISAGDPGVVDMAWYTGTKANPNDTTNDWYVDFAQIRNANTDAPQVSQSRVFKQRMHHGDICLNGLLCELGGDRSLLDYFQIQVGPDGVANIAFANNGFPDTKRRVWYARQTSGLLAGNGLHDSDHCPGAKQASVTPATPASQPAPTVAAARQGRLPATGGEPWRGPAAAVLAGAAGVYALRRPGRRRRSRRYAGGS
jgi:hypothetical protein